MLYTECTDGPLHIGYPYLAIKVDGDDIFSVVSKDRGILIYAGASNQKIPLTGVQCVAEDSLRPFHGSLTVSSAPVRS